MFQYQIPLRFKIIKLKVVFEGILFMEPSFLDHCVKLKDAPNSIFFSQEEQFRFDDFILLP